MKVSIYRKPSGIWHADFRLAGRRMRPSLKTRNAKVAETKAGELAARIRLGLFDERSPMPLEDAFDLFLAHQKQHRSAVHVHDQRMQLGLFRQMFPTLRLGDVRPAHISAFLDSLTGRSASTVNQYRIALSRFFNWAMRERQLTDRNPVAMTKARRAELPPPDFLTREQREELLEHVAGTDLALPVLVALYTGMRRQEIQRLVWRDVDFDSRTITVRRSKSLKFRAVPMAERLEDALRAVERKSGPVCRAEGKEWSLHTMSHRLTSVSRRLPFPVRWHLLRHTFASHVMQTGKVTLYQLQRWLGHSTPVMTQRYAHLAPEFRSGIDDI